MEEEIKKNKKENIKIILMIENNKEFMDLLKDLKDNGFFLRFKESEDKKNNIIKEKKNKKNNI